MDDRTTVLRGSSAPAALTALLAALFLLLVPAAAASPPTASAVLPEPVYSGPLAIGARAALNAPAPGSGGWYWPVGTEDFQGWSGWLDPRGAYVHVAQDMPCAVGRAVVAIGDGVVFISRADAGGYGVGGAPGGCIIITHTTASGTRFHALYGHVSSLRVKAGERVVAGQQIAKVNGCRHLHFSTHPGTKYRDGNPYAGHVPKSWGDHGGFVDPVKFLRTNPSAAAYRPPEPPRTTVATETEPLRYGAAEGAAYWSEEGDAGSMAWRLDLATGVREALAADEAPPDFDTHRYEVAPLASPAVGFSVADLLPVVTLTAKHDTPVWGAKAVLMAGLTNGAGRPIPGGVLKLQRSLGDRWQTLSLAATGAKGTTTFRYRPSAAVTLRAVFAPPAEQPEGRAYLAARSSGGVVTPHVQVTTPRLPKRAAAAALITVTGRLVPRDPAGTKTVRLRFQRRGAGGAWLDKLERAAVNRDLAGGATRYVAHARLAAGSWRVRAVRPADDAFARTATAWRTFVVY